MKSISFESSSAQEVYDAARTSVELLPSRIVYPPLNKQQQDDLDKIYIDFAHSVSKNISDSEQKQSSTILSSLADLSIEGAGVLCNFFQGVIEKIDNFMQKADSIYPGLSSVVTLATSCCLCGLIALVTGPATALALKTIVKQAANSNTTGARYAAQSALLSVVENAKKRKYFRELAGMQRSVSKLARQIKCHPGEILSLKLPKELLEQDPLNKNTKKCIAQFVALQRDQLLTRASTSATRRKIVRDRVTEVINSTIYADNTALIDELKGVINTGMIELAKQARNNNPVQQVILQEKIKEDMQKKCTQVMYNSGISDELKRDCAQKVKQIIANNLAIDSRNLKSLVTAIPSSDLKLMKVSYAMLENLRKIGSNTKTLEK
ncbi:hypothetical protein Sarmat_00448 [Rickettsiales endosymbiont of Paramecium tredecaurelia]|nr:hypothetical protein [Candidatus Sarmatiella mevalonica]